MGNKIVPWMRKGFKTKKEKKNEPSKQLDIFVPMAFECG